MSLISYVKEKGVKRTFQVFYCYKIELILEKIVFFFTRNIPLKDIVMIESHNDFDCNGGAFFDYLISHGYNKRYKIVWFVRKKYLKELPQNVECVRLYGPSLRKAFYVCMAKWFTYDCEGIRKVREDQKVAYCSHGAGAFKNIKGKMFIPDSVDFILTQSPQYAPIQAEQWSIPYPNEKIVYIGYPAQDTFFDEDKSEIKKIIDKKYEKIILWMPTFRKGGGYNRNDSFKEQKMGIPLIDTMEEYIRLNDYLYKNNFCMIIKIHPKQDLANLEVSDLSNIIVLTGDKVKKLDVDNYHLMKCTDALISDYSSAAYDYLQLNRPIAYVLDDMQEYHNGFVVDDIHDLMAGHEIYTLSDLENFLSDLANGKDIYRERREQMRDYIYLYHDGRASERLAKLLGIE